MGTLRRSGIWLAENSVDLAVDGAAIAGSVLISVGCWNYSHPFGEITAGVLLIAGAIFYGRNA